MSTMPGLPATPAYMNVDIDEDGRAIGLGYFSHTELDC